MTRFTGNIFAKMDAKGRAFVPAAFRKLLSQSGEDELILRKDIYKNCLVLYPSLSWNEELNQLRQKLNKWDELEQSLYRQFIFDSEILKMDANGRILIPKRYQQMAGISGEIRFVGIDNTIEIWSCAKVEEELMSPDAFKENMQKILGGSRYE